MRDSNTILPPANFTQQLNTTSADASRISYINNALSGVAFDGFNATSAKIDGTFRSFQPIRAFQPSFTLPTVGTVPTSMSSCFQKSVQKLEATKFDGDPLSW